MLDLTKRRIKDVGERVVVTFVGAFIAIYLAAFAAGEADLAFLKDPGLFDKAKSAGIAATVPLIMGLFGLRVGDKGTGSVVPSNKPEDVELPFRYIDNPTEEGTDGLS